jgi:predicted nicotinamide N-methyase
MTFDIVELDERRAGYGHQVWRAAAALCIWILKFVPREPTLRHARILELGSGIGLPSILLASLENHPFSVTATDLSSLLSETFLENLYRNKSSLKLPIKKTASSYLSGSVSGGVSASVLNWDDSLQHESAPLSESRCFNIIFGADLVYNPAHARTLVAVVCRYLSPSGFFVLMNPPKSKRRGMGSVVEELKKRGNVQITQYKLLQDNWPLRKCAPQAREFDMEWLIFIKTLLCIQ